MSSNESTLPPHVSKVPSLALIKKPHGTKKLMLGCIKSTSHLFKWLFTTFYLRQYDIM